MAMSTASKSSKEKQLSVHSVSFEIYVLRPVTNPCFINSPQMIKCFSYNTLHYFTRNTAGGYWPVIRHHTCRTFLKYSYNPIASVHSFGTATTSVCVGLLFHSHSYTIISYTGLHVRLYRDYMLQLRGR